jgi:hypothetical protein
MKRLCRSSCLNQTLRIFKKTTGVSVRKNQASFIIEENHGQVNPAEVIRMGLIFAHLLASLRPLQRLLWGTLPCLLN